jgi:hypothetical protein
LQKNQRAKKMKREKLPIPSKSLPLKQSLSGDYVLIFFILQPIVANTSFPLEDFILIFIMGWICFIPFGLFIRDIIKRSTPK